MKNLSQYPTLLRVRGKKSLMAEKKKENVHSHSLLNVSAMFLYCI